MAFVHIENKAPTIKPSGLARVVEFFELHVGGLGVDPLSFLPLLCGSLRIPIG
jgi:hypothetical protein